MFYYKYWLICFNWHSLLDNGWQYNRQKLEVRVTSDEPTYSVPGFSYIKMYNLLLSSAKWPSASMNMITSIDNFALYSVLANVKCQLV